jgi:hypothetical protein
MLQQLLLLGCDMMMDTVTSIGLTCTLLATPALGMVLEKVVGRMASSIPDRNLREGGQGCCALQRIQNLPSGARRT